MTWRDDSIFKLTLVGGALVASLVIALAMSGQFPGSKGAVLSEPIAALAPIEITMVALERRIEENEVGAMAEFEGRELLITGKVLAVLLDSEDNILINMEGSGLLPVGVRLPDSDKPMVSHLRKGDSLKVSCLKIAEEMAKPILGQCTVVRPA